MRAKVEETSPLPDAPSVGGTIADADASSTFEISITALDRYAKSADDAFLLTINAHSPPGDDGRAEIWVQSSTGAVFAASG